MPSIILVYSNKILSGLSQTMQVSKIRSDNSCRSVCDIPLENVPCLLGYCVNLIEGSCDPMHTHSLTSAFTVYMHKVHEQNIMCLAKLRSCTNVHVRFKNELTDGIK